MVPECLSPEGEPLLASSASSRGVFLVLRLKFLVPIPAPKGEAEAGLKTLQLQLVGCVMPIQEMGRFL